MDIAAFKYSIQYVPQTTATIFAFSSSLSFFYDMYCTLYTLHSRCTVQWTLHSAVSNRTRQASFFLRQRDISTASMRHFYCVNATFLLRQRDISTASSRHFYCVIATFLLHQRDISTASMRHFYCVNVTFLLCQRDISTASTQHFYCVNVTFAALDKQQQRRLFLVSQNVTLPV